MTQIFVGNLPYGITEEDLQRQFECFGRVSSVRLMTDSATNRSRGFAFVHMPSLDDADEAIKRMSDRTLNGRQLTVNESQNDRRCIGHQDGTGTARNTSMDWFKTVRNE